MSRDTSFVRPGLFAADVLSACLPDGTGPAPLPAPSASASELGGGNPFDQATVVSESLPGSYVRLDSEIESFTTEHS